MRTVALLILAAVAGAACGPPAVGPGTAPANTTLAVAPEVRLDRFVADRLPELRRATAAIEPRASKPAGTRVRLPGTTPAIVSITYFYDLACPHCRVAQARLDAMRAEAPDVHAIVPRAMVVFGARGLRAHLVRCAAAALGQDVGADIMRGTETRERTAFDAAPLLALARARGLDPVAVVHEIEVGPCYGTIRTDHLLATRLGVPGTPMFFVNGLAVDGGLEELAALATGELDRFRAQRGTSTADFQRAWWSMAVDP